MVGIIQKIEYGKVTISTDEGQTILIPIADVEYESPKVGDEINLYRRNDEWVVLPFSGKPRSFKTCFHKLMPVITIVLVAVAFVSGLMIEHTVDKKKISRSSEEQKEEKVNSLSTTSTKSHTISTIPESDYTEQESQKKADNTVNIEIYSSFNVKNYIQNNILSSKKNKFDVKTNADGYDEKTGELDTSVPGAKTFTISSESGKDITLRVNVSNTVNITPENPNPIMYRDDKLKITASHFTTDNTGLDMYHFFFNVTNDTGNDINLFVTSFSIDDKSSDNLWGSTPNHQGKSVADLVAGSPSEVHQWGLDNFDKIKFTLQIDGYTGHDMLTVNGTVSHDMFQ